MSRRTPDPYPSSECRCELSRPGVSRDGRKPKAPPLRLSFVTSRKTRATRSVTVRTQLTTRLADPESMARGLEQLTSHLRRYTIVLKRSAFDWDTGKPQQPNLVLFEDEPPVANGSIDPRILKSKSVVMLVTVKAWTSTSELRRLVDEFNISLLDNARSRFISSRSSNLIVGLSFLIFGIPFVVDLTINSKLRRDLGDPTYTGQEPWGHWFSGAYLATAIIWALLIFIAFAIDIIRSRGGPLRIWPQALTVQSLAETIYRIRVSEAIRKNINGITIAVLTGLIVYVLTRVL
jgi:hypothetical protein